MNISNPELELALEFVAQTNTNIFLTGKAGTGKTTFLHNLKKNTHKRIIVTAPTGVAAINARGVTLHSFFQMPFGPFVPGSEEYTPKNQHRFSSEKIQIIKNFDLLVIDEISMVRADLLDGVDAVLRRYRHGSLPFGGVQLLMIGDLHQLAPVVKDAEWQILQQFYDSFFFFGSNALRQTEWIPIELKHIYRQSDQHFIDILNRVRDNQLDENILAQLNSRYLKNFVPDDNDGYITLSTHNSSVDALNETKLNSIPQTTYYFNAEIEGDFPEYSYPTAAQLKLKNGAQVMFVRNDPSVDKLYYNGKIGKITRITDDGIYVKCPDDAYEISVTPIIWENIKYLMDEKTKEITENKIGQFKQFPLKLAWAITIHKSQGLTFERAIIDAKAAFAHGQVYVALSRCKTFAGMVLSSPISTHAVKTDNTVANFTAQVCKNLPSLEQLTSAKLNYQQRLLMECFTFTQLRYCFYQLSKILFAHAQVIKVTGCGDLHEIARRAREEIFIVSENFQRQLQKLCANNLLPETDAAISERVAKGSVYFQTKLDEILINNLRDIKIDTDNREISNNAKKALSQLHKEIAIKLAAVKSCQDNFSPSAYLRAISDVTIIDDTAKKEQKNSNNKYTASDIDHAELLQTLKEWRTEKATAANVESYRILHQKVIIQIAINLPHNLSDLNKINGIGKRTMAKYGDELLAIVTAYRAKHPPAKEESAPKVVNDTKKISFDMFTAGQSIPSIAAARGLVASTIEGHLAFFVMSGKLDINQLLSCEKQQAITQKFSEMNTNSFSEIKHALGDDYSYGEIKIMQAYHKYLETHHHAP